jgi:hypothetical protein
MRSARTAGITQAAELLLLKHEAVARWQKKAAGSRRNRRRGNRAQDY